MTDLSIQGYLELIAQACTFSKSLDHITLHAYTPDSQRPVFYEDDWIRITLWEGPAVHLGIHAALWQTLAQYINIPEENIQARMLSPARMVVVINVGL